MSSSAQVFDRQDVRRHRDRAAPGFSDHDFLFVEVADRLAERLEDLKRTFPTVLEIGSRTGLMSRMGLHRFGAETLIQTDLSPAMLAGGAGLRVATDPEFLPFRDESFDLVVSCLDLHWVNDLPGALIQLRQALKPTGLLLVAVLGGETLGELRHCLASAEIAAEGGISPRCSPMLDIKDAGMLLQRAGYAEPVVDSERITVSYGDPLKILKDLRGMGETNAVRERRKNFLRRGTLFNALERYAAEFGDGDNRFPVTYEVLTLTAWATNAPQPAKQEAR
ncbi:MAG: methyltransferase domain-containing protein [Magnetospiraceae bacterium]